VIGFPSSVTMRASWKSVDMVEVEVGFELKSCGCSNEEYNK